MIRRFDNIFDKDFCDRLIAEFDDRGDVFTKNEVSEVELPFEDSKIIAAKLKPLIAQYLQKSPMRPEMLAMFRCRIMRYPEGTFYPLHCDDELVPRREGYDGDFFLCPMSIVIYLNQEFEGGQTYFPEQNATYQPQTGSVLMFPASYAYPHGTTPNVGGERFVVVAFYEKRGYNDFYKNKEFE